MDEAIKVLRACTVTYGHNISSYLSARAIVQLAIDEGTKFPKAVKMIEKCLCVDDCLTGSNDLSEIFEMKNQFEGLCALGKFELHKWCSNVEDLLNDIPLEKREMKKDVTGEDSNSIKALGIVWDPKRDVFIYRFDSDSFVDRDLTKRTILSDIARFYDPIGILEPLKFHAKVFMQELWQRKYDWDSQLDEADSNRWQKFREEMRNMNPIEVDRCVSWDLGNNRIQIHGFGDASSLGYGACVYVRSVNEMGQIRIKLLGSRSRVAPLKTLTIPRLELLAASLLAELLVIVRKSIPEEVRYKTFLWSDSKVVLAWIRTSSRTLKTFVSNKVSEIQETTNIEDWRYVNTKENPADVVSRGLLPAQIEQCKIWFHGPDFLMENEDLWPIHIIDHNNIPELETEVYAVISGERSDFFDKYSDLRKLIRITAFCLRFIGNMKRKRNGESLMSGAVKLSELQMAENSLIRNVQAEYYMNEIDALQNGRELDKKSSLLTLSPFIDRNGILRMGGRLSNALVSYEQKHPAILPPYHPFTSLLIRMYHRENLHSGTQFVLCFLRRKYWIIHGRNAVKKEVKFCVKCFKCNPKITDQYMGDLPGARVQPSFPFMKTGVDYCGHFWLKANPRGTVKTKGYICVFRCMVTGGIHLELVSDMSTEGFMNALYRFVGRRGEVAEIFSDNGTNFKGAVHVLNGLYKMLIDKRTQVKLAEWCEAKYVDWHFIPPRSPHMGGTWESAVKLTKGLLVKIMGNSLLSYEEFSTVLCRIESILNSRPITKLNDDPTDLNALTPGHLIIGRPLNELVEPELFDSNIKNSARFEYLVKLKQEFWKRWTSDYLNQLQMRFKWHTKVKVSLGQMVIVKDENSPSNQWLLGRIIKLHPGNDQVIRVVTVLTKLGEYVRPLVKLCFLPISDNENLND